MSQSQNVLCITLVTVKEYCVTSAA